MRYQQRLLGSFQKWGLHETLQDIPLLTVLPFTPFNLIFEKSISIPA
jgi:hypothetical protein